MDLQKKFWVDCDLGASLEHLKAGEDHVLLAKRVAESRQMKPEWMCSPLRRHELQELGAVLWQTRMLILYHVSKMGTSSLSPLSRRGG